MQELPTIPATAAVIAMPKELAKLLKESDALLALTVNSNGIVEVKPVVPGQDFDPESNQAHLLAAIITHELPNLMAAARGDVTDALRYQALREFAMLAKSDPERFEKVNVALQAYETANKVNLADHDDPDTFDAYASFLADALLVTHPDNEAEQPKELVIPGSKIILPYR